MRIGLRTTIFWNLFVLMALAAGLISMVVYRVFERETMQQRRAAAELFFKTAVSPVAGAVSQGGHELQALLHSLAESSNCSELAYVDSSGKTVARAGGPPGEPGTRDPAVRYAMGRERTYIHTASTESGMTVSGPVYAAGRPAGVLKAVLPLQDAGTAFTKGFRIVFIYILFDAAILLLLGTFLMTRAVVRPLRRVIRLTEDINEDHFGGLPLFFSDKNEIGKLTSALKSMAGSLDRERSTVRKQIASLEEKNSEIEQAHRQIIQSEKLASVGRLAAGIAHEIGNPAGIILGYIHMLRDADPSGEERRDYLMRMEAETERISATIRELLDYAHPASGERTDVDINSLIRDIWMMVARQQDFAAIAASFSLAEKLPCVIADEKQIRQVVLNLVLNAGDAMPDGGTIVFHTNLLKESVSITVSDTGCGIPENIREKVFDPFFTTKQASGTGLGLANVHRIVDALGGTVSVESEPGQGSSFTVTIPLPQRI